MALKSRSKFKSCAARRKDLKGKGKGKSNVGAVHRPLACNPSSVFVLPASEAEDSAASFQGASDVSEHQRVQPMRQAKLLRVPIVDGDIEHQLVFPKGSNSSTSSTSSNSSSSSSSDSGSSSSSEDDCSEDDDVYVSGGSTISAAGSDSSSSSHVSLEPRPQPKKYRRTAVHSQGERVLDVEAISSDGCPVHMPGEGKYIIDSSN